MDGSIYKIYPIQRVYPIHLPEIHIASLSHSKSLPRCDQIVHELTLSLPLLNSLQHNANSTSCTDITFESIFRKSSTSSTIVYFFTYA